MRLSASDKHPQIYRPDSVSVHMHAKLLYDTVDIW